ncbi:hypothetical protein [Pedobacter hartonius]|uniref:Uncharacterized protein n=1 Tax=Pedobacter hartonius TaxID=425514 RepID=A0A1H3W1M6_9SPHI|nr:hypothetical protein [Pedobacter hartonius]SDZ80870.1 hypothetical protein SAMN05443550_10155 [Pedobacter hartonius]
MKRVAGLAFIFCFILLGCKKDKGAAQDIEKAGSNKTDYTKESIKAMENLRPKLYGTWSMEKITVKPVLSAAGELGFKRDTTLLNLASLNIDRVDYSSQPGNLTRNDVTGMLKFKTKSYPVGFRMLATPTWITEGIGPQTFALFEFRFPVGSHLTETEEAYLSNLTLIGENYSINMSKDGKTMIWKGLNRAIESIEFVRK